MRKPFFTLLLLAGFTGTAHAQQRIAMLKGFKVGGSFTTFSGGSASGIGLPDPGQRGYNSRTGFHMGVFANFGLTPLVSFQPELLYSQKGTRYTSNGGTNYTANLSYIDVPLALRVGAKGFFAEAGPQVGFLVSSKFKDEGEPRDVADVQNFVDAGYLVGVGYQPTRGFGGSLRYNGGLRNIGSTTNAGGSDYYYQSRNSAFQVAVTYSFMRGKKRF